MGALEGVATSYSLMILSQRVREVALSAARNREEAEGEVAGSGDGASGAAAERKRDVKAAVVEKKKVLARRTFKSQNEPDLLPLLVSKRALESTSTPYVSTLSHHDLPLHPPTSTPSL